MNQDINGSVVYNIKALMTTKMSDNKEMGQTPLSVLFPHL